jgi:hypothetical protein
MYTLKELFEQASEDVTARRILTRYSDSYVYKGLKITKDKTGYTLYDTKVYGDIGEEITIDNGLFVFFKYGFRMGCYFYLKNSYSSSLESITKNIQKELETTRNKKSLDSLKVRRETYLNKYSEINRLINKFNSHENN